MTGKADMTGKTVVVTGANSGIGLATARALAAQGARVVMTGRDQGRLAAAEADVAAVARADAPSCVRFDLADLDDVRRGAGLLLDACPTIDVLVHNAGVVYSQRRTTPQGFEATFAVNHLAPFLLTARLRDRLKASAPSRVVTVASTAHRAAPGGLDFDDLQAERRYRAMEVYGRSKLANILFTVELARRLEGTGVTANCLHPGTVATRYGRDGDTGGVLAFGLRLIAPFVASPERGARTSIYLAGSPEVEGVTGRYFVRCRPRRPAAAATDPEAARRLWAESEALVGEPAG